MCTYRLCIVCSIALQHHQLNRRNVLFTFAHTPNSLHVDGHIIDSLSNSYMYLYMCIYHSFHSTYRCVVRNTAATKYKTPTQCPFPVQINVACLFLSKSRCLSIAMRISMTLPISRQLNIISHVWPYIARLLQFTLYLFESTTTTTNEMKVTENTLFQFSYVAFN